MLNTEVGKLYFLTSAKHISKNSRPLVRIKEKFQVTLPSELRARSGLAVGDFLEVSIERGGVITLTPKSLVDRHIAEGVADLEAGRAHGPYESADETIAALDKRTAGEVELAAH